MSNNDQSIKKFEKKGWGTRSDRKDTKSGTCRAEIKKEVSFKALAETITPEQKEQFDKALEFGVALQTEVKMWNIDLGSLRLVSMYNKLP